jgi:hypothetical protein
MVCGSSCLFDAAHAFYCAHGDRLARELCVWLARRCSFVLGDSFAPAHRRGQLSCVTVLAAIRPVCFNEDMLIGSFRRCSGAHAWKAQHPAALQAPLKSLDGQWTLTPALLK